ncbi:MAG TPA: helicase-related protein, partial [Symbiobacteriaceae bacterium]|nr:helicase-related protein [Symbiobacteriaceae bacterium]
LYRVWGGRGLPTPDDSGVLIASVQQLYQAARHPEDHEQVLTRWSKALGAVVIDEAHHAIAPSYTAVLEALGYRSGRRDHGPAPLLGLTATPYRSASQTPQLARRFQGRLITPWPSVDNPIGELQARGILAETQHEIVSTSASYDMTEAEKHHLATFGDLAESFVKRVGLDPNRNHVILKRLLRLDATWPTLFFGCSKEHATAVALLLRRNGVSAAVVTAETGRAARRASVEDFRSGRIRVLCNYGIFTTGFDAPNVRAVVVARPTTSVVLYEQMIGRGMRGPLNGGTAQCLVIDFGDNLERFGVQMAHTRFSEYWKPRGRGRRPGQE